MDSWLHAITLEPSIASAENLTRQQLMDHLPALCRDLAQRLRTSQNRRTEAEVEHAHIHGHHRWTQGYALVEVIRESGVLRQIILVDVLDRFVAESPTFPAADRRAAEAIVHRFFTDILVESAQQYVEESGQSLLASERNYQAILDSALDCIIVMGEDALVREWNPAAERLFGYSRAEAMGAELAQLIIPPELRAMHRRGLTQYLATGEGPVLGKRIEVPALRADGSRILVELAITPYHVEGKAVFTAYIRDITERERGVSRREAQYAIANLLSGSAPLAEVGPKILEIIGKSDRWDFGVLWMANDEGTLSSAAVWSAEPGALEQFEKDARTRRFARGEGLPGQVLATGKAIWIDDITRQPELPRAALAQASGLHGALFFPLLGASGVQGAIEVFSREVSVLDEDLLRLVEALGIQIGLYLERKRTEEELREQKDAAEAANSAKDRFLAALSHELRTPLNPVLMWACATAEDENITPELREGLEMVCRNIGLEARLIDDLLDLTRIARGKLHLNLQLCSADSLLRHAIEIVRSQLSGKDLRLTVDLAASNHQIMADPTRIEQVFWNLLKNAQKFTPEHGEISVRSYEPTVDTVAFEVSDSGPGIDPDSAETIFAAFEQGSRKSEGLGLGLAICKAIVDLHGGTVTAANRPSGGGAVFTVALSTSAATDVETTAADFPAARPWRKLKVLIVEDHASTASVMSRFLERSGHEVLVAATVSRALEILPSASLDLLVSDLGLPDGTGYQIMRELLKTGNAKGIAVSGYGMDEDLRRSNEAGFSAHLTKPIDLRELKETIQRVTNEE